jgi:serine/threonine protein phosphatase PrpC
MPLITHFALSSKHDYLLLASDGLWDELNEGDIHEIYTKKPKQLGKAVFDRAISEILQRNRISNIENLNKIDNRRNLHDDITIVNLNLQMLRK